MADQYDEIAREVVLALREKGLRPRMDFNPADPIAAALRAAVQAERERADKAERALSAPRVSCEEWAGLLDAATPGEWVASGGPVPGVDATQNDATASPVRILNATYDEHPHRHSFPRGVQAMANVRLAAAAPALVRALLAERERAESAERERDEARQAADRMRIGAERLMCLRNDGVNVMTPAAIDAAWEAGARSRDAEIDGLRDTNERLTDDVERARQAERERIAALLETEYEDAAPECRSYAHVFAGRIRALTSADRLAAAPRVEAQGEDEHAAPHSAQLQTACETLERVACALTDIDPVHPALAGARAVLESCEWTPGGKVGARQRFLDRVDAAGEPPSSILAGRVEAQGEDDEEPREGDVYRTPSGDEWEVMAVRRRYDIGARCLTKPGWYGGIDLRLSTRVRRGGQQP